ncbi:hypothetical protein, partial [Candidatus Cardinium hertigii]|uniref:hypothetical protein n=1 Tax=Candidatus Cardinium hertigii TaxID=247481 RepID=UPI001FAAAB4E
IFSNSLVCVDAISRKCLFVVTFFLIKKCAKNQALDKKFWKSHLTAGKTELARCAGFKHTVFLISCKARFLLTTFYKGAFLFSFS